MSDSLWPYELPCPSLFPWVCSNSCPLSHWCHPTTSFHVVPFSPCPETFPASGSFPMSQFFTSGGQGIGASVSAPVLPMNIQCWCPLGWTGLISCCPRDSQAYFSTLQFKTSILWCSTFFMVQLSHPYMTTGQAIVWVYGPLSAKWCVWFLILYLGLSKLFFQGGSVF